MAKTTSIKCDYKFHVADPSIIAGREGEMLILRFQVVEPVPGGHRRNGKYVHLDLTKEFAMQLLANLRQAQEMLGLDDPPPLATVVEIPPSSERH